MGWATLSVKRIQLLRLTSVSVLLSIILVQSISVNGQISAWTASSSLSLKNDGLVNAQLSKTFLSYPNIDCIDHEFIIRPARLLPTPQTQKSVVECAVETNFGYVSNSGLVQMNGTNVSGQLKSHSGNTVSVVPISNSSDLIQLTSSPNGSIVSYYQKIYSKLSVNKKFDGSFDLVMPSTPSWILKDKAQNTRYIKPATIAFSDNGKWMFADSEHVAGLIVNLETKQIIPFARPYTYHLGTNPTVNAALDNEGKVVVTTSAQGALNITDINSCPVVPDAINAPVSCISKQFNSFLTQQISGYKAVRKPRMVNDKLMSADIVTNLSGITKVERYRMAPFGEAIENTDYLALGDSYQSGEGAYDYYPETDTDENMCHLSKVSYPYLIGQSLNLYSYNSVACSGAKIENINDYVQRSSIPDPNSMGNLLPGYRTQASYVKQLNPSVITVGIGGNDIGFGDILIKCINFGEIPSTCYENYEDRLELVRLANKQLDRLTKTFAGLKSTAPNVYTLGYPSITKNNGDCAVNVRLNSQEIIFSNLVIDYLNLVIKTASKKAGVRYLDVTEAFLGHRMCEVDSEDSAVNGVTFGDDGPFGFGPIGNEGFHPNKFGHQLLKAAILNESNNFGSQMPIADDSAKLPSEDSGLDILNSPTEGRPVRNLINDTSMVNNTLAYDEQTDIKLDGQKLGLKPNTSYTVELHSEPYIMGTLTTDGSSNIIDSLVIPDSIPLGMHTVHVLGENLLGEQVDIYKIIFVADSMNDFDGDGSENGNDSCQLDINRGIDVDSDSIDDICDLSIVIPEEEVPDIDNYPEIPNEVLEPDDEENTTDTTIPDTPGQGEANSNNPEQNTDNQTESEVAEVDNQDNSASTIKSNWDNLGNRYVAQAPNYSSNETSDEIKKTDKDLSKSEQQNSTSTQDVLAVMDTPESSSNLPVIPIICFLILGVAVSVKIIRKQIN
jgi:lysophospholipase L1-like esterase